MFKRSAQKNRAAKHTHEFSTCSIGADLQRQVCCICGQVSIASLPPTDLRPTTTNPANGWLTVVIDEAEQPVGLSWRSGEQGARR